MSGIAAIIRFDGGDVERESVEKITEAIAYRGPDGIQHRRRGSVALGHCMMHTTQESLVDQQPLCNEDESVALVLDGSLSNWEELRKELLSRGARLRTRSDAELVLRAYEAWSDDCPKHIDGEFSFLIWDGRRQEAFCVRDHAGLRPLHYYWNGKRLVIASDIAGVLAGPGVEQRPNRGMIAEYMADDFISQNETIWCGVMRVPPATWIAFGRGGTRTGQYWSPPPEVNIRYKHDEEYFEHYSDLFADCVRRASRTHLPLACEVSGGLDSSAVFAIAHQLRRQGRLPAPLIKGYTLIFEERNTDVDEIAYARAVGEHVGAEIREVPRFFPELSWFQARGLADRDMAPYPNGATGFSLGETAVRDGCRVVLNGHGGDQWLVGSPLYYAEELAAHNWPKLYRIFREDLADVGLQKSASWILRFGFAQFLPHPILILRRKLLSFFSPGNSDDAYWLSPELKRLLKLRRSNIGRHLQSSDTFLNRRPLFISLNDGYNKIALSQAPRFCARSGYEPRSPMYARRFIEFAFGSSERMRSRGGTDKYVHRKAMAGLLPDAVTNRTTKADFKISFTHQLDGMSDLLVNSLPTSGSGCLDQKGMAQLFETRRAERNLVNPDWKLWGVFGCENAFQS